MPLVNCATVQDFIDLYGDCETLEITRQCDELADTPDLIKLQAALDNAHGIVNSRYFIAPDCGKALIKTSCKQIILWVTRELLDFTKSRPFVDEDYRKALELLDFACTKCSERCPLSRAEINEILGEDIATRSKLRCCSGRRPKLGNNGNRRRVWDHLPIGRFQGYLINYYDDLFN